ncbi:MAG: sulfite exporter TauE/SafE family protein [Bacteroidaceae bacterium]|nr:sulfite exporter TauE/SafE family protein [Bacteroidaceae bacterium]
MAGTLLILFALSACAGFVQRVSGFGFGIFIMMFLPYIMPSYNEAVALSGILSGCTAMLIVVRNRRYIQWRAIPVVLLSNIAVSYFVIIYMGAVDGLVLRRCLGVALMLVSLYFIFLEGRTSMLFSSRWSQATVGALSGLMGSMFAMPGPPVVLYGVSVIKDKRAYMATMQTFWLLFNVVYLYFRSGRGYYTADTPLYLCTGIAGVFLGIYVGARVFCMINKGLLKKVIYGFMLLSGLVALLK